MYDGFGWEVDSNEDEGEDLSEGLRLLLGVVKDGVSREGSPGDSEGIRLEGIDVDSCGDFDYPRFL